MKLIDAIKNVNKSKANYYINTYDLFLNLKIENFASENVYDELKKAFKGYWLFRWYCTDSHVGYSVIYFEDEPLCFVSKLSRKSDSCYQFVSSSIFNKARE
jgi:hypothetical protein